jgi:nucleoside phosphorylase
MKTESRIAPTLGIVTALPHEFKAILAFIEDPVSLEFGKGAGETYVAGTMPSSNGQHAVVAMLLPDTGNNSAGIGAALMSRNFPSLECIFMTGIAGGIPHPLDPNEHVRLGDIVVSNRNGVVQYDYGKTLPEEFVALPPPRPPSAHLLQAARMLMARDFTKPLASLIARGLDVCGFSRPGEDTDLLFSGGQLNEQVQHPRDPLRIPGEPRIFLGPIASANQVLKNAQKRDLLRQQYRAKAVEMEGSGLADAAWTRSVEYFVVRGICDYCDSMKRDDWQNYAAVAAAAYTRLLLTTVAGRQLNRDRSPSLAAGAAVLALAVAAAMFVKLPTAVDGHLYIQTQRVPVQIALDGKFVEMLTSATPFTSRELPPGEHTVSAISEGFRHDQTVRVHPSETVIVDIPSK